MNMLSRRLVAGVFALLIACSGAGQLVRAQEAILNEGAFRQATSSQKRKALNDITAHRIVLPPNDLQSLLRAGLEDEDPDIKVHALSAVAGRAGAVRLSRRQELTDRWKVEREALKGLRGHVVAALEDMNERVRRDAIIALVNLDYEEGGSRDRFEFSPETLQLFMDVFRRDESLQIRGLIVNELSLSGSDTPALSEFFIAALNDKSSGIVAHAARGLATRSRVEALPRLVQLLTHQDQRVRLVVSQTVASYRELAIPYLSQVDSAAQAETDPIVKKTLEGTRSLLMQARAAQTRPK